MIVDKNLVKRLKMLFCTCLRVSRGVYTFFIIKKETFKMKKVLIIGASGRAGSAVVKFLKNEEVALTLVSRSITPSHYPDVTAECIAMNGEDTDKLSEVVKGQDIIVVVSNGDAWKQSQALLEALKRSATKPERIFWLTGMGIHGEVPGIQGLQYKILASTMKSYIKAADAIAEAPYPSVLIRAPRIVEEEQSHYQLIPEGQKLTSQKISYQAIGRFIADGITGKVTLSDKESLGITY